MQGKLSKELSLDDLRVLAFDVQDPMCETNDALLFNPAIVDVFGPKTCTCPLRASSS